MWKLLAATTALSLMPMTAAEANPSKSCQPLRQAKWIGNLPRGTGEVSGMASSVRRPGVAWMIRDSGNPASLYALRLRGGKPWVREIKVKGARNKDWEDITYTVGPDGKARLLIVESTQSGRAPYIYEVFEPDPDGPGQVRLNRRYRYRYPGNMQNTEASFMYDGDLVLVTKTVPAKLYRFARLRLGMVNRGRLVGQLHGSDRFSIARPSRDRFLLVASDHETVTTYRGDGGKVHAFTAKQPAHRKTVANGDNIEAGDFYPHASCHVLLISERRNIYRVTA